MRRALITLTLAAAAAALALALTAALSASAGAGASTQAASSWPLTLSAAPDDFSLAQLGFREPRGRAPSARSLRATVSEPFGDDYAVIAVAPRTATPKALRVLVLLVNRPSALEDPVDVHMRVVAPGALGRPRVRVAADGIVRRGAAAKPPLCDLRLHGAALDGSQVSVLAIRGAGLGGFDAAAALAQAYDAACSLPFASAFEQAVLHPSVTPSGPPAPEAPAPEPPVPPVGKLPGEGCVPKPGYACPGIAARARAARAAVPAPRSAAGAH
jgi:hypothetical protein